MAKIPDRPGADEPEPQPDPQPEADYDDRTIGELLADAARLPNFAAFADEPEQLVDPAAPAPDPSLALGGAEYPDTPQGEADAVADARKRVYEQQRQRHGMKADPSTTPAREKISPVGIDGEIMPPLPKGRYESRIQIVEAWIYPGTLVNAPEWIDRNWTGFAGDDVVRGIAEGPCLRVPSNSNPAEVVLARIGDVVARQNVAIDGGVSELRVEVWAREQFERMFVAKAPERPAPRVPQTSATRSSVIPKAPRRRSA